jgi:ABC-2 type transport system ATP-binding protein
VTRANDAPAEIVATRGLAHRYGNRDALRGVDLAVSSGEIFALLGPNGGGKSTLFRILVTLLAPSAGEARVLGHDVTRSPWKVRAGIGVTFQSPSLDPKLTVRENLLHQGHLHGLRGRPLASRIDAMLELFGLADRAKDAAEKLSGGLARRVDLAKALLHSPSLLLLDEPSTGLDPAARADFFDALRRVRREEDTTCLLTTHLMEEAAKCDRVGFLDEGRLVACGRPGDLVKEIGGEVITLVAEDPAQLAVAIRERFGEEATWQDGVVRLEREDGAAMLPEILSAFPGRVTSATVARPSLEDVFLHKAGRSFSEEAT